MPAILQIDQAGLPAGTPGFSRSDGLSTGALVTVSSLGSGLTVKVRLLAVPLGDVTALASLAPSGPTTWTFLPTALAFGTYRVELIVDEGLPTESRSVHTFAVRTPVAGLRIPAYNEKADPNATDIDFGGARVAASETNEPTVEFPLGEPFGWWRSLAEMAVAVEALVAGGGPSGSSAVIFAPGSVDPNVHVTWAAAYAAMLALPIGARNLIVDASYGVPVVPAAAYVWESWTILGSKGGVPTTLQLTDGVSISIASAGNDSLRLANIRLAANNTAAPVIVIGATATMELFNSELSNSGLATQPLIDVPAFRALNILSTISSFNAPAGVGRPGVFRTTAPLQSLQITGFNATSCSSGTVSGNGQFTPSLDSTSNALTPGVQFVGSFSRGLLSLASRTSYDDVLTAPPLGIPTPATTVQQAVDILKQQPGVVLFEWNGVDTSQFSAFNPLPLPGINTGIVNPSISVGSDPISIGDNYLSLAGDSSAGNFSTTYWLNLVLTPRPMKIQMDFITPLPLVGEELGVFFTYAGDLAGFGLVDQMGFNDPGAGLVSKRRALQVDPLGFQLLAEDTLNDGGYVWRMESEIFADRGDVAGFPPNGIPRANASTTAWPFAPPPQVGRTSPLGALYITNALVFPPDPAWGASTCDKLGIGFNMANRPLPAEVRILRFRILSA